MQPISSSLSAPETFCGWPAASSFAIHVRRSCCATSILPESPVALRRLLHGAARQRPDKIATVGRGRVHVLHRVNGCSRGIGGGAECFVRWCFALKNRLRLR